MSSSLRLVTSKLVTGSIMPFRQTVVSASHFTSIDCHSMANHRSYATMPIDDFNDQPRPRILWPKLSKMSFRMEMTAKERVLKLCGSEEMKTDKDLEVVLKMRPGLYKEVVRSCADHKLPDRKSSDIKEEMKDGISKDEFLTNDMANIIANDVLATFRDITTKHSWPYYELFFDRSILAKGLCPMIGTMSSINSFSIYNLENDKGLYICMNMPGVRKMKLTTQGLRVSLNFDFYGPKRKDIKTFVYHDTFFIEVKENARHYITGIHLPEGIHKKHNMIKKKMKDGVLYAFIPCCVKKEELPKINDQLKRSSDDRHFIL